MLPTNCLSSCSAGEGEEEEVLAREYRPIFVKYLFDLERLLSHLNKVHVSTSPLLEAEEHHSCGVQFQQRLQR